MSISLYSFAANTKAKSTEVNSNFNALKSAVNTAVRDNPCWGIQGTLATGNEQGMKYVAPYDMEVQSVKAYTDSGTCDIRIQKDSSDVTTVSSVGTTVTSSDVSDTISENQKITLDITSVSSASGLWVVLECRHNDLG